MHNNNYITYLDIRRKTNKTKLNNDAKHWTHETWKGHKVQIISGPNVVIISSINYNCKIYCMLKLCLHL